MLKEFKEFAMRGNMLDMAVGVIIGAAFGRVVTSLVNDVIMPPIGVLLGKVDFSHLGITLHEKTTESSAVILRYGSFINAIIDFLIVSFAIFILIKQVNKILKPQQTTKDCPFCYSKIAAKASRCPHCTSPL